MVYLGHQLIKKHLRRIDQGVAQVARGLEVENQRLIGYMTLNNHRLDNLVNITVSQQQAISNLTDEINNVHSQKPDRQTCSYHHQATFSSVSLPTMV